MPTLILSARRLCGMLSTLCMAVLLATSMSLSPVAAQDTPELQGTIGVSENAPTDEAIATRIRDIIGQMDGYQGVTVTVAAGIVTLEGTVLDATEAERLNVLAARVEGVVAISNRLEETTDVGERLTPAVDRFVARLEQAVSYLPLLAIALLAFVVVVSAGFLLARLRNPWNRMAPNAFIADLYRQIVRLVFTIGGIVIALDILNATALLSTILGAAGIIGLAVGFAVKDTVENYIASIMLSVRQPFRPNDAVEINGDEGKVIRLTSRATILLSYDGNHIRIPNATVFKSRIVNYSRNAERRFVFDLGLATDADLARAVQIARDTLAALPFTLETPAPNAWIEEAGDSTYTLRLIGWIDQNTTAIHVARGEAIRLCAIALNEAGIELPEPGYRLIGADMLAAMIRGADAPLEAETNPSDAPSAPVEAAPAIDVKAHDEHALEAIVAQERRDTGDKDLLAHDARIE